MVPLIEWGMQHSVHVERFDEDHRQLIAMLNELHDGIEARKGKAVLRQVLLGLAAFSEQHFAAEEAEMERTGFPEWQAHAAEHRQLVARVREFVRAYEVGDTGVSREVLIFLREWVEHHMLVTDQKYTEHLNAHGVR
jgi:hemerythrin